MDDEELRYLYKYIEAVIDEVETGDYLDEWVESAAFTRIRRAVYRYQIGVPLDD